MCIIAASAKGKRQPSVEELRGMFRANPDGAGFMYAKDGIIRIKKGFMTEDDFLDAVKAHRFTKKDAVVYHCRIATQAGGTPTMTHPFMLSANLEDMRWLEGSCHIGITHNGIVRLTTDPREKQYSDTALFITRYMSKLIRTQADMHDAYVLKAIDKLTDSKWALMDKDGDIETVGAFHDDHGVLFSNWSYLPQTFDLFRYDYDSAGNYIAGRKK